MPGGEGPSGSVPIQRLEPAAPCPQSSGDKAVTPGRRNRNRAIRYDERRYRERRRIRAVFGKLNDFRRVAACYDKLAHSRLPSRSPPPSLSGPDRNQTLIRLSLQAGSRHNLMKKASVG